MPTTKTKKQPITLSRTVAGLTDTDWPDVDQPEGELSIDVFHDQDNIYIQSTVAGDDYFCRECFWGRFSRSIILPFNVQTDKILAELTDGVLTVTLPKLKRQRNIPI